MYNFGDSVKRYLEHTGQGDLWKSGPTKKAFWNFFEDWGWDGKKFVSFCNDGADEGFIFTGPARKNSVETMRKVKALGHTVVIITDRQFGSDPSVSHKNTFEWLEKHEFPYDELHFSADKTIVPTEIFVEDKLENFEALTAAGTDCWLINRSWNDNGKYLDKRIDDISDYYDKVLQSTYGLVD